MAALTFDVVSDQDGFERLADGWDALVRAQERPSPFLLHGWVAEWWRHFGSDLELRVHLAHRDGALVGALPLVISRARGLRVADFPGGGLSNFADVLADDDETARALLDRVQGFDLALLHGLTNRSRLARVAASKLKLVQRVEAPVLDMTGGWEQTYTAKVSSKKRSQHRRRRRQLEEQGALEVRTARTADELDAVLDDTFRLHELRWAGRFDGSGYATPEGRRFHRAAIRRLAEVDVPRITLLSLDGTPIAFHYFFALEGAMYVHRLAFDPGFSRLSPGLVNNLDALEAAAGEGLTRVEYMGAADRYKLELADGVDPIHDGFGLAQTRQGRVAAEAQRRALELRLRLKESERLRSAYLRVRALASR